MVTGDCRLCAKKGVELQHGHILPKFAWDWLKETSVGAIRSGEEPNIRVQDGPKEYLLCRDCEGNFSRAEKVFAEQIFAPVHAGGSIYGLRYTEWAMRFAVSVSWRVLVFNMELTGPIDHLSEQQLQATSAAERQWRAFLVGETPHTAQYQQHLVVLDLIDSHTTPGLSPFINRYIARVNDMDVIASPVSALTYANSGKFSSSGQLMIGLANGKVHASKSNVVTSMSYGHACRAACCRTSTKKLIVRSAAWSRYHLGNEPRLTHRYGRRPNVLQIRSRLKR
jgi:hypothetical protein